MRPQPWVAAAVAGLYLAVLMAGVLFLRLQIFVDALIEGGEGARGVVLTFDDGPDPDATPRVLDTLAAAGVTATFFVIGHKAERHPELVREIVARGHLLGVHSYAHDRLFAMRGPATWRRDLTRAMSVLETVTGERPRLFRPPIGHTNPHVGAVMRQLQLEVVGWSVGARDGLGSSPEAVTRRVLKGCKNGSIVLLHDARERGGEPPASVEALPGILAGLAARGLAVVALSQWLPVAAGDGVGRALGSIKTKRAPPA